MKFKGIYAITDENFISDNDLEFKIERAILGGVSLIQLRDKQLSFSHKLERAKRIIKITRKYNIPLIINDDPFLAKEVQADGVHLGEDEDYIFPYVRYMLKNKIIGVSCYGDLERAFRFQFWGVDYVAFGSVFPTKTKETDLLKTLEIIKWAKNSLRVPIVAIGGINPQNYKILLDYGVDMIALVSAVFDGDPYENLKKFHFKKL
jgi:thiamine-phosphate pyrophosphorylase